MTAYYTYGGAIIGAFLMLDVAVSNVPNALWDFMNMQLPF